MKQLKSGEFYKVTWESKGIKHIIKRNQRGVFIYYSWTKADNIGGFPWLSGYSIPYDWHFTVEKISREDITLEVLTDPKLHKIRGIDE